MNLKSDANSAGIAHLSEHFDPDGAGADRHVVFTFQDVQKVEG